MSKDLQELQGKFDRTYDYLRTGHKFVSINPRVEALNDTTPTVGSWTEVDISSIVPPGAVAISCSLICTPAGGDSYVHLSAPPGTLYEYSMYMGSEVTYPWGIAGNVGISVQKFVYYTNSNSWAFFRVYINGYWIKILQT